MVWSGKVSHYFAWSCDKYSVYTDSRPTNFEKRYLRRFKRYLPCDNLSVNKPMKALPVTNGVVKNQAKSWRWTFVVKLPADWSKLMLSFIKPISEGVTKTVKLWDWFNKGILHDINRSEILLQGLDRQVDFWSHSLLWLDLVPCLRKQSLLLVKWPYCTMRCRVEILKAWAWIKLHPCAHWWASRQ